MRAGDVLLNRDPFDNGYMSKEMYEFKRSALLKARQDWLARRQAPVAPRLVDRIDGLGSLRKAGTWPDAAPS